EPLPVCTTLIPSANFRIMINPSCGWTGGVVILLLRLGAFDLGIRLSSFPPEDLKFFRKDGSPSVESLLFLSLINYSFFYNSSLTCLVAFA
ncbi:MAG: hypothetical protein ACP5K2_10245, partial [bacterium]